MSDATKGQVGPGGSDSAAVTALPRRSSAPQAPTRMHLDWGIGAGALLREELAARGLSQAELAGRTGLSAKHVNQVVQGVAALSADTALLVERAIGLSAELLIAIDATHQAQRGREAARLRLAQYRQWLKTFPIKALAARGVVDTTADDITQLEQLLTFFGVADPTAFEKTYDEAALSFRRAQHLDVDVNATAVWLRLVERAADALQCGPYNRSAFAALLPHLPELTRRPAVDAFPELQARCGQVGVAVVYEPEITGARMTGALCWIGTDRPVMAVTGRHGFEDSLWFALFHEAGHLSLHPRRRNVIDLGDGDDQDGAETEANLFAERLLLRGSDPSRLQGVKTHAQVRDLAEELRVDAGIVAGLICHRRSGSAWRNYRPLRRPLVL